jgi:hypothetical protein
LIVSTCGIASKSLAMTTCVSAINCSVNANAVCFPRQVPVPKVNFPGPPRDLKSVGNADQLKTVTTRLSAPMQSQRSGDRTVQPGTLESTSERLQDSGHRNL